MSIENKISTEGMKPVVSLQIDTCLRNFTVEKNVTSGKVTETQNQSMPPTDFCINVGR